MSTNRKQALVVDDGPVERLMGKALLEKLGYEAATAAGGAEALAWLQAHDTALVLCDISMPGMDGMALLDAARAAGHRGHFIMASSHDDAEQSRQALAKGARAYLTKPLRFDALRDIVAGLTTAA